jgi:hypothetical protein
VLRGMPTLTLCCLSPASGRASMSAPFMWQFRWPNQSAPPCRVPGTTLQRRGRRWSSCRPTGNALVEPPRELLNTTPPEGMMARVPP